MFELILVYLTILSSLVVPSAESFLTAEPSTTSQIKAPSFSIELTASGKIIQTFNPGTLDRDSAIAVPIHKLPTLSETARTRKIKVAFVDCSPPFSVEDLKILDLSRNSKIVALRERLLYDSPALAQCRLHGDQVLSSFHLTAEKYKMTDRFEYYFCPVGDVRENLAHFKMQACLDWLKSEKVDAINFSLSQNFVTKNELATYKLLASDPNVLISFAAGNDNQLAEETNVLCKELPGVLCVGSHSPHKPKKNEEYSNFGKFVNLWEDGNAFEDDETIQGTSFASPRALAKFLIAKMNGDLVIKDRVIKLKCPKSGCLASAK